MEKREEIIDMVERLFTTFIGVCFLGVAFVVVSLILVLVAFCSVLEL